MLLLSNDYLTSDLLGFPGGAKRKATGTPSSSIPSSKASRNLPAGDPTRNVTIDMVHDEDEDKVLVMDFEDDEDHDHRNGGEIENHHNNVKDENHRDADHIPQAEVIGADLLYNILNGMTNPKEPHRQNPAAAEANGGNGGGPSTSQKTGEDPPKDPNQPSGSDTHTAKTSGTGNGTRTRRW